MDDRQIVELYFKRSESAITETAGKYGRYCHYIAYNILHSEEDAEECVNDTYLKAWNCIPPHKPDMLSAFLGKITRNLSLNLYAKYTAQKRGLGQTALVLSELEECLSSSDNVEQAADEDALVDAIDRFLAVMPSETRKVFMRRYWYLSPVKEIADGYGISESKVKMTLFRTRKSLRQYLEKEGVTI
ncbi:MAG: sigma-70 family RNA polymerase sigma factor [Clostridia bacterium]